MSKRRLTIISFCLFIIIGIPTINFCFAVNPEAILKEVFDRQGFTKGSYIFDLKVSSYEGKESKTAGVRVYFESVSKQIVTFIEPDRLKDNSYLVIGYNTWLYQKGLQRPIRISAKQKLFGDAGIAETVGINYLEDYKIVKTGENDTEYLYELIALNPKIAYQKAQLWINKNGPKLKEVLLLAVNGKPLKKLTYFDHHMLEGHQVATVEIQNLLLDKDQKTIMEFKSIQNRSFPIEVFDPLMMNKIYLLTQD